MHSLLAALPFLLLVAGRSDDPCTLTTDEGAFYDLSSLKASKDYSIPTSTGDTPPLLLNVCKPVTSETWKINNPSTVGGYIRRSHADFSVGKPNTTLKYASGSVQLYMLEGSTCPSGSGKASCVVDFVCDKSVFSAGEPQLRAQLPMDEEACSFFVEWRTHVACPTGARSGPWGFFVTLIVLGFLLLMIYLVLGTAYNRFVLNLRGFDQVPSFSPEGFRYHVSEAISWFRDAMSGFYEGGQGGQYSLPRTNPVSHQSGVDSGEPQSFTRPGQNQFRRPQNLTNPVSHQNQVAVTVSPPTPTEQSASRPPVPVKEEQKPFLVGDDDDDEMEGSTHSPQANNSSQAGAESGSKPGMTEDGTIRL